MRRWIDAAFLLTFLSCPVSGYAQDRWVQIQTNRPESNVYADSTWLGLAGHRVFRIPDGTNRISLIPANADFWSVAPVKFDVSSLSADTTELTLNFPYYYSLESVPSGATVYIGSLSAGSSVGTTPTVYTSEVAVENSFVFEKEGYELTYVVPEANLWNRHLALLESETPLFLGLPEASTLAPKPRRKWIDYLAVSAIVVGGTLAIHYKTKANSRFATYSETGNPDLRPTIESLDTRSAVALGVMQVGVTVIVLRLVF